MDQQSDLGAVLLSLLPIQPDHLTAENLGLHGGGTDNSENSAISLQLN